MIDRKSGCLTPTRPVYPGRILAATQVYGRVAEKQACSTHFPPDHPNPRSHGIMVDLRSTACRSTTPPSAMQQHVCGDVSPRGSHPRTPSRERTGPGLAALTELRRRLRVLWPGGIRRSRCQPLRRSRTTSGRRSRMSPSRQSQDGRITSPAGCHRPCCVPTAR